MKGSRKQSPSPESPGDAQAPPVPREWLTIQEVAARLRVSRDTVERWIHSGSLGAVDVSSRGTQPGHRRSWRISWEGLQGFLNTRRNIPGFPKGKPRRKEAGVIEFIK